MARKELKIGDAAPNFNLKNIDGEYYSLNSFLDYKALIIVFTCNHCPYARAYEERLIKISHDYNNKSVIVVAINSNDEISYPEDSFENMKDRAVEIDLPFVYLRDDSQEIAKAYGVAYTPEIFLFDKSKKLAYKGKIDDNWREPEKVKNNYLRAAIDELLADKAISIPETFAIGCTIKWKK